ncbi:myelin protein zero-like protein 2 isoform X1 [Arapaima gigas]
MRAGQCTLWIRKQVPRGPDRWKDGGRALRSHARPLFLEIPKRTEEERSEHQEERTVDPLMSAPGLSVLVALGALLVSGVLQVRGIKVFTAGDVEAVNGTDAWLKCTFKTSEPISESSVTVSWSFRPLGQGQEESVFYYHGMPYPPEEGRFRKRIEWSGNIMAKDVSITVRDVKFSYNGTFICQVKNPPDVHGLAGEVRLKVVASASYSEIAILASAIGGGILLMLIILIIIVVAKHRRRKYQEEELECQPRVRKDPDVCHPEEAVHFMSEEKKGFDYSYKNVLDSSSRKPKLDGEKEKLFDDDTDESQLIMNPSSKNPSMKEEKETHFNNGPYKTISGQTSLNSTLEKEKISSDDAIDKMSSTTSLNEEKERHYDDATDRMSSTPNLEEEQEEQFPAAVNENHCDDATNNDFRSQLQQ